jgi:hypothetical protein
MLGRVLMGKAEGKRRLGRPRHTWEGTFKIIFKKCEELSKSSRNVSEKKSRHMQKS